MINQLARLSFFVFIFIAGCSDSKEAKFRVSDTILEVKAMDHAIVIFSEGVMIATVIAHSGGYTVKTHNHEKVDSVTVAFEKWRDNPRQVMRTVMGRESSRIIIYDDRGGVLDEWVVEKEQDAQ